MDNSGTSAQSPEHGVIHLWYVAEDESSHYTMQLHSSNPDAVSSVASRTTHMLQQMYGGTNKDPPSWTDHVTMALLLTKMYLDGKPTTVTVLCSVAVALAAIYCLRHGCRSAWHLVPAAVSAFYLLVVVVNIFIISQESWYTNARDAALLTARLERSAAGTALVLALALVLVAVTTISCCRAALMPRGAEIM